VRREKIEVDNESLDSEFNQTLNNLSMQGLDFGKIRGGKKGQQRVAQAVAMESANRLLTRRALDVLKTIAMGQYKSAEDSKADMASEGAPVKSPEEALEEAIEAEAAVKSETEADS
jgi:hypothetical protein